MIVSECSLPVNILYLQKMCCSLMLFVFLYFSLLFVFLYPQYLHLPVLFYLLFFFVSEQNNQVHVIAFLIRIKRLTSLVFTRLQHGSLSPAWVSNYG